MGANRERLLRVPSLRIPAWQLDDDGRPYPELAMSWTGSAPPARLPAVGQEAEITFAAVSIAPTAGSPFTTPACSTGGS